MLSKKWLENIRSSGFGFTSGGESTIRIFTRKIWTDVDIAGVEKNKGAGRERFENF
jgi:hypothetical protein